MSMIDGNEQQKQQAMDKVALNAITQFARMHPEMNKVKAEIPSPLKWASAVIGALFTMGIAAVAFWLVSSVSAVQVTLARMDERQIQQSTNQEQWKADVIRRLDNLEKKQGDRNAQVN